MQRSENKLLSSSGEFQYTSATSSMLHHCQSITWYSQRLWNKIFHFIKIKGKGCDISLEFSYNKIKNNFPTFTVGARGGVVVNVLRYKPAGRGFDSR
jgi:hypothetical protein